ncbi:transcriptional regulator TyrR [Proteus myxofaciens]|uniref:HTH-type transcriptional regulatory protein TyrR n=1 Tax=Proteus myxofaciens ATCC 19692 TaxID=1354337 RepID=A0A198FAY3_9GAMM|nr:transcriptional regulator TyrR [Proteus myxofaciens]OAT21549.1 TyrR family transcriptional repressor [Proteus myxofaciens ATCC 19692]
MRLEVTCEDRIGLTRELLDLLVLKNIDLRGIEILPIGLIYLNFSQIDFDIFQPLMAEIRRINGVTDVRTVTFMPSEQEHKAMWTLLESVPVPVFSINIKGHIKLLNPATRHLFDIPVDDNSEKSFNQLIPNFNIYRWLEQKDPHAEIIPLTFKKQKFDMEIVPIKLVDDEQYYHCVGAFVLLKYSDILHEHASLITHDDSGFNQIIAVSAIMKQIVEQAKKMSKMDAPLLLVGDTGTGKDIFAKACHLLSNRSRYPFLGLNCASLPDDVVENELFGYAAGAYPNAIEGKKGFFEQANNGTVLLDEIGEMSPQMQIKLLRFLNDGTFRRVGEEHEVKVDIRIICATQKNLWELVQKGLFREDLYYRLNVLTLTLPPLCDRKADIMPLVTYFVSQYCNEQKVTKPLFSPELSSYLAQYTWPGNIRQLRNTIYQAMAQLTGNTLRVQDITLPEQKAETLFDEELLEGSLDEMTKRFEASILARLYRDYPSTRKLAKRLGISHTAIANKLREYNLTNKKNEDSES